MTCYVDQSRNRLGRMVMSHMFADTLGELHDMAAMLGLRREWFQDHNVPHYDVCQSKRALAIWLGAVEIERGEVVKIIRRWRGSWGVGVRKRDWSSGRGG